MSERPSPDATTRRRLLAGAVGAAGVALAGPATVAGTNSGAADEHDTPTPTPTPPPPEILWQYFQADARNTGHLPGDEGPADEVGAQWNQGNGGGYTTTPVVRDDIVVAADEGAGLVRAFDFETGAARWQVEVELNASRLALYDGSVLVPSRESNAHVQALNIETGQREWAANLGGAGSGVVVDGPGAYVAATDGLYRVSRLSAEVDWKHSGVSLMDTSVAVADGSVYAAGTRYGSVVKLGTDTGGRRWGNNLAPALDAPTVAGGYVLVPTEDALVALGDSTGREEWRREAAARSSVAVADGTVYGTVDGVVVALSLEDGTERWRTAVGTGSNPPIVAGGLVYAVGEDGSLAALDPDDGATRWTVDLGASVSANPAVGMGQLYLGDGDGRLLALAAGADGDLGGASPTPSPTPEATPTASPTPTGGGTETATPSATPTATSGGGSTPGGSGSTPGGGNDAGSPTPTEALFTDGTSTPTGDDDGGGGGLNLPLVGGAVAAVAALLGGGLWWRNNKGDEYDPLG